MTKLYRGSHGFSNRNKLKLISSDCTPSVLSRRLVPSLNPCTRHARPQSSKSDPDNKRQYCLQEDRIAENANAHALYDRSDRERQKSTANLTKRRNEGDRGNV
jgi:hypothetical protein